MAQAASDLGLADPTRLYRRFLAWTLPEDATCRLCGSASHDAIPGLPPRLLPCKVAERLQPGASDADRPHESSGHTR
jgi:hypothetical protein